MRPSTLRLDVAFRVGRSLGNPGTFTQNLAFRVIGLGPPAQIDLGLSFAVSPPEPTVYLFHRGDWQPVAQRAWTSDGWVPPAS